MKHLQDLREAIDAIGATPFDRLDALFDQMAHAADKAISDENLLIAACRKALNFIANTESELGITLESGGTLRAALAAVGASVTEPRTSPTTTETL
jgi:hypothetical protein